MENSVPVGSLIALIGEKLKPGSITGWFHLIAVLDEIKQIMEGKDPDKNRKIPFRIDGEMAATAEDIEKRLSGVVIRDADLLALRSEFDLGMLKSVQTARNFASKIISAIEAVRDYPAGMIFSVFQNYRVRAFLTADLHDFGELDDSRKVPLSFSYGGMISPERPRELTPGERLEQFISELAKRDLPGF